MIKIENYHNKGFKLANDLTDARLSDFGSALRKSEQIRTAELAESKDKEIIYIGKKYKFLFYKRRLVEIFHRDDDFNNAEHFEFSFVTKNYTTNKDWTLVEGNYIVVWRKDLPSVAYFNDKEYNGHLKIEVNNIKIEECTNEKVRRLLDLF